jgi:hypothetical protein
MRNGRARTTRRVVRIGVGVVVLLGATALRSSGAESPQYPGLPDLAGGFVAPIATGLAYDRTAMQWLLTPDIQVAGLNPTASLLQDPSCRRLKPFAATVTYSPHLFFLSPPGAPAPYGYQGPYTVRTVAFGAIPVEARIELRQPRDAQDLPLPIDLTQTISTYCSGLGPHGTPSQDLQNGEAEVHTTGSGQLDVEITRLTVDGIDVGLRGGCATTQAGTVTITSPDYNNKDTFKPGEYPLTEGNTLTTPYFSVADGGLLHGSMDIPAFAGCTTVAGEDLSRLVTATVSGEGNAITLRASGLEGSGFDFTKDDCWKTHSCKPFPDLPIPATPPS